MMGMIDEVGDLIERFRRCTREQWLLRGGMVLAGVVAMLPLWLVLPALPIAVPALVALGVLLALASVVAIVMGMAPFALASLVGLVAAVGAFWTMLDRRRL